MIFSWEPTFIRIIFSYFFSGENLILRTSKEFPFRNDQDWISCSNGRLSSDTYTTHMNLNTSSIDFHGTFYEMGGSHSALDIFRLTLSSVIFVVTLFANVAAIIYIYKHKQLRSIKNYYYGYYLINLNIADLLVAILCIPFTLIYYQKKNWTFGAIFCKVMPTTQVMSVSASICTLAMITWERYRAIVYPMTPRSTIFALRIKLLLIWVWALIVAAPSFYAYKYNISLDEFQCRETWPRHYQRQGYTVFMFVVNYAVPLSFILISYAIIVVRLKFGFTPYSESTSKLLQKQFIKSMTLLITSFAICYLPGYVCFFIMDFGVVSNQSVFLKVLNFSHVLIWINSCLNPFFYSTLNGYMKKLRTRSGDSGTRADLRPSDIQQQESFRKLLDREEDNVGDLNSNREVKLSVSSR